MGKATVPSGEIILGMIVQFVVQYVRPQYILRRIVWQNVADSYATICCSLGLTRTVLLLFPSLPSDSACLTEQPVFTIAET